MSTKVLEDIREELKEIKLLYRELIEKLIPAEEPTQEEKKAIEEKDETADEEELMKTLGWTSMFAIKIKRKVLRTLAKTDRNQKQKIKSVLLLTSFMLLEKLLKTNLLLITVTLIRAEASNVVVQSMKIV